MDSDDILQSSMSREPAPAMSIGPTTIPPVQDSTHSVPATTNFSSPTDAAPTLLPLPPTVLPPTSSSSTVNDEQIDSGDEEEGGSEGAPEATIDPALLNHSSSSTPRATMANPKHGFIKGVMRGAFEYRMFIRSISAV